MKQFLGTKLVNAKPMTRLAYNNFRGWELPKDENGDDEGYLVEYVDGGKPNTKEFLGYVSWSPKEQFDNAYRLVDGFTFGEALEALKKGLKVSRKGWNGVGMFLYYVPEGNYPAETKAAKSFFGDDALVPYRAYIAMKAADNHVVPWLASQSDMLCEDWKVVD